LPFIRSKKGNDNEDYGYMLFVGRHVPYKNIKALVELSAELQYPLVSVGDGCTREQLEEYSLMIGAPVRFTGNIGQEELVEIYNHCSFYITNRKRFVAVCL